MNRKTVQQPRLPRQPTVRIDPRIEPSHEDGPLFEELCVAARTDLQWAAFLLALDDCPDSPPLLELLMQALLERTALTDRLWREGLLPRHLERFGEGPESYEPKLDAWLLNNIETLRGEHPLYEAWAALNDERLRIAHRLPRLN